MRRMKEKPAPAHQMGGVVKVLLQFNEFINQARGVERTIWYNGHYDRYDTKRGPESPARIESKERDGEHSWQLEFMAWFLNNTQKLGLDNWKLTKYCKVHDLPEFADGDVPMVYERDLFGNAVGHVRTPAQKVVDEEKATRRIERTWGKIFPEMVEALRDYRAMADKEALFVYTLDKLIAVLNIAQDGGRTNHLLGVTREVEDDYKRPKISKDPFVLALYDELSKLLDRSPELFASILKAAE